MTRNLAHTALLFFFITLLIAGCQKEEYLQSADVALQFSRDTIDFDTLFSETGSVTHYLKVYNPYNEPVKISRIFLARNGVGSPFRLNINGEKNNYSSEVKLRAHDSMFIFIETTIKNPEDIILEKDSIVFITNGVVQDVKLRAWGKAVQKIPGELRITQDTTLYATKPYLFSGNLTVMPGARLILAAGSELYFERKKGITVYGSLHTEGTIEAPVLIRSSRIDEGYRDVPGLWNGILFNSSDSLVLRNTHISQAITALRIEPVNAEAPQTPVSLYNVSLRESSYAGILAQQARLIASNILIANSGNYSIRQEGGHHTYHHATIANYYPSYYSIRTTPAVFLSDQPFSLSQPTTLDFYNSIVYGNNPNEFLVSSEATSASYSFHHSLIRIEKSLFSTADSTVFESTIFNQDPLFLNVEENGDFNLDTLSPAIDIGHAAYMDKGRYDIEGEDRTLYNNPDAGAYERTYGN